jgi:hypothetical protein
MNYNSKSRWIFKVFLNIIVFQLFSLSLKAQPVIDWKKCYGGSREDYAFSIILTKDGGYFVIGDSESPDGDVKGHHLPNDIGNSNSDGWVIKLNAQGIIEWQKCLGGSKSEQLFSSCQTNDGGYAVLGYTASNDGDVSGLHSIDTSDVWVVKLNDTGLIQWSKTFGGSNEEMGNCIIQTLDGGYLISSVTSSGDGDLQGTLCNDCFHAWIIKLDSNGSIKWKKVLDDGGSFNLLNSVIETKEGDYILAGYTSSHNEALNPHGRNDVWIIKLDTSGRMKWQKTYGGSLDEAASAIIQTEDGGYAVIGSTSSNDGDVTGYHDSIFHQPDLWLLKLDSSGGLQWQKAFGSTGREIGQSILEKKDHGFILLGGTNYSGGDVTGHHGGEDVWLIETDSTGNIQWQSALGSYSNDHGSSLSRTSEDGFIFAATAENGGGDVTGHRTGNTFDYWIVKFLPQKNGFTSSSLKKDNFALFPNPNTGIGTIKYSLNKPSQVRIEVYDAIGRSLRIITNGFELSGNHEQPFDLAELPSGQYFLHLESEEISVVQGFELIK